MLNVTTTPAAVHEPSTEAWTFPIGTWVTHRDQPMPSLVMDRVRTTKGREIYGVRSFAFNDQRRDRMILGEYLVAMDDDNPEWQECLLAGTPLDPRCD